MFWIRNRNNTPNKIAVKEGPEYKQSFKLWLPFAFALASSTIRNFAVAFSSRTTDLCGLVIWCPFNNSAFDLILYNFIVMFK